MDPRALTELLPDWKERGAPLKTPVVEDRFLFLGAVGLVQGSERLPARVLPQPRQLRGEPGQRLPLAGHGRRRRWAWRSTRASPAAEVLYDDRGGVRGVATGDVGIGRDGKPTDQYQPGIELLGKYTFFAEGCRGHLGRQLDGEIPPRRGDAIRRSTASA